MGQQQLLLVILVTIIVGIATVVAINTFGSAADNANVDAVRNDLLSMSAAAQAYYIRPTQMGGGGNDFSAIEWNDMGSVAVDITDALNASNENGDYLIEERDTGEFDITATPTSGGSITITVLPDDATMGDYTGS